MQCQDAVARCNVLWWGAPPPLEREPVGRLLLLVSLPKGTIATADHQQPLKHKKLNVTGANINNVEGLVGWLSLGLAGQILQTT